jgi:hypothetical protein
MTHFHAAVWIDHFRARVFDFNASDVVAQSVNVDDPPRQLHHKAGVIGSGRAAEDNDYFDRVARAIKDAGVVLIAGPANAKGEFMKHLQRNAPDVYAKVAAVKTVDHQTDREFVDFARRYFHEDHQAPLRSHARSSTDRNTRRSE